MALMFNCPSCGASLRVGDEAAGRLVRCGRCQDTVRAPASSVREEPPAAPPVPHEPITLEPAADHAEPIPPEPVPTTRKPGRIAVRGTSRTARSRSHGRERDRRRGVGFWLAVGIPLFIVLLAVAGGAAYQLFQPQWRTHESEVGGFRVDLPATPKPLSEMPEIKTAPPGATGVGAILIGRREEYIVMHVDIPPARRNTNTDDRILDDGIAGAVGAMPGAEKLRESPIEVSGCPGREAVIRVPNRGTAVLRFILAADRAYVLAVAGPWLDPDSVRARRFLDSFAITGPDILARVAKRADDARRVREAQKEAGERMDREIAEARKRFEEGQRQEAEKERQRLARLEAFKTTRYTGRAPAKPEEIEGLHLHIPFDEVVTGEATPFRRAGGSADRMTGLGRWAAVGPGVRGSALVLPMHPIDRPGGPQVSDALPRTFATGGPITVAGWVRARSSAVQLFRVDRVSDQSSEVTAVALGVSDKEAWARVDTIPGEEGAGQVFAPWPADETWHHLAASVEPWGGRQRVKLYLDGRRVAVADYDFSPRTAPLRPAVIGRSKPYGPAAAGPVDELVVALDDLCVFSRALTPDEIRRLAAADEDPAARADAPDVRLTAGKKLPPLRDVMFDTRRGKVWIITAAGDRWLNRGPQEEVPGRELHRYSYPEFEPEGRWALNGNAGGGGLGFDPTANVLFVPVDRARKPQTQLLWQHPTPTSGELYRLDLDDLPAVEADEPPRPIGAKKKLTSEARDGTLFAALTVSADGKWVYFFDGSALCRVPADLSEKPDRLPLRGRADAGAEFLPANRDRLRLLLKGSPTASPRVVEVDTAQWAVRGEVELPFGRVPVCHPDGRAFAFHLNLEGRGGVFELDPATGVERLRRITLNSPTLGMGLSPDGRRLFAADVTPDHVGRVIVFDATAGAPIGPNVPRELGRLTDKALQIGGPFWVTPDGKCLIFRSGQVVKIEAPPGG